MSIGFTPHVKTCSTEQKTGNQMERVGLQPNLLSKSVQKVPKEPKVLLQPVP